MQNEVDWEAYAGKVVEVSQILIPRLVIPRLVNLLQSPHASSQIKQRREEANRRGIRKAIDCGLLSLCDAGNYCVRSKLFEEFYIGIKLEDQPLFFQPLFFTLENDCEKFAARFAGIGRQKDWKVMFEIIKPRPLEITGSPSSQQWKEIRLKQHYDYGGEGSQVMYQVLEKKLMQESQNGGFEVFYRRSQESAPQGRRSLNLRYRRAMMFFSSEDIAKTYADSFGWTGKDPRIEIVGYSKDQGSNSYFSSNK